MQKPNEQNRQDHSEETPARPFARTRDLLIILLIVLTIACLYFFQSRQPVPLHRTAVFADVNGKTLAELPLTKGEDKDYVLAGYDPILFHIYEDGSIAFVHSDCPDQVCVHTGRILKPGQFAACLPNGIILKIRDDDPRERGSGTEDLDIVVGHASAVTSETEISQTTK